MNENIIRYRSPGSSIGGLRFDLTLHLHRVQPKTLSATRFLVSLRFGIRFGFGFG